MATNDDPGRTLPRSPKPAARKASLTGAGRAAVARPNTPLLAYVLHRYDWSETSLIVELFTRSQGRLVVVAKGAKRPTSQLRPVLLPFQPLHALLGKTPADANNEVHVLRTAEWTGGRPLLPAAAMFSGFYLNELLLKLLVRQDAQPALFDVYADTLSVLATGQGAGDEAAALRAFELQLLRELGWLPALDRLTLTTEALHGDAGYTLNADAGLVPAATGLPGAFWSGLETALARGSSEALRTLCAVDAAALRVPLRNLLHYHLGPAPLHTRQVWQGVQRLAHPPGERP